jgi:flagellar biosynthetic protein FliQ
MTGSDMTGPDIGLLFRETMLVVLKLGGPALSVGLAIGLVMSLVQAVTQIHEQTLAFVPKLVAICLTLMLLGPFMSTTLTDFTHSVFDRIVAVGGA